MARTIITTIIIFFASVSAMVAQNDHNAQRKQWFDEMRQLRTNYIAKDLDLSKEQREKFVPIYDAMSREVEKVMRETRSLYNNVKKKGEAATDVEKEKAAEAMYECRGKENAIEMKYFSKFKSILTPDQLFKLKSSENKFNRQLMKQRKGRDKK